jgi:DNA-binding FadR family transcriptional regulator
MEIPLSDFKTRIEMWVNETYGPDDETPNGEIVSEEFQISETRAANILAALRRERRIPPSNRLRRKYHLRQGSRHELTFEYIRDYIEEHGWAPSQREISQHIEGSLQTVNSDLQRLQKNGLIKMGPFPRQIRVVESVMKEAEVTM